MNCILIIYHFWYNGRVKETLHQNKDFNIQITRLEDDGVRFLFLITQCINTNSDEGKLFDFYEIWKMNLVTLSEKIKERDFELSVKSPDGVNGFLSDMVLGEHLSQGKVRTYTRIGSQNIVPEEETLRQIKAVESGVKDRMKALSLVREKLREKFSSKNKNLIESDNVNVYKNKDGRYFINEVEVNIKNNTTIYYTLFDILYILVSSYGEEIKYISYIKHIKLRIPKTKTMSDVKIKKMISDNLISEKTGFFRRINRKNKTLSGGKLIEVGVRGQTIRFNNKK